MKNNNLMQVQPHDGDIDISGSSDDFYPKA